MKELFRFLLTAAIVLPLVAVAIYRPTFGYPPVPGQPVNQVPQTAAPAQSPEPAARPSPPAETGADPQPPAAPQPAAQAPAQPPAPSDDTTLNGVDVSHYQGTIDWKTVAGGGVGFAIMKATEGLTYVDPKFASNLAGVQAAGMIYGAYHFYEPTDDPVQQADHFLQTTQIGPGWLPAVLDLERAGDDGVPAYQRDVQAWLDRVETRTGCRPMIYASPSYWTSWLGDEFAAYQYYLAEYASTPKPPGGRSWVIWQHSQTGQVTGIDGNVDLDVFRGTADDLKTLLCGG